MVDLSQSLKQQLQTARIAGLELPDGLQVPVYDGFSIMNVPASICAWLGMAGWQTPALDEQIISQFPRTYRQVIQIVVDGMGLELLERSTREICRENERWQALVNSGCLATLTSITPSTTSAALTSFWTGKAPAQHGITGYEMWLRDYNLAANMITHTPAYFQSASGSLAQTGFDPRQFLGVETLGPYLKQQNVETFVMQHKSISGSGLSNMLFADTTAVPFRGMQDLFITLEELASQRSERKRFIYAYWSDLDELQHVYSSTDIRVKQELRSIQQSLVRLVDHLRKQANGDTLLMLTADHGQVITAVNDCSVVQNYPELIQSLHMMPTGESRLPYLYLRPGMEERVRTLIEQYWPGKFLILRSEEALKSGLFGPPPYHPEILSRIGDLVLVALDNAFLYWPLKENRLLGRHGGMDPKEMFVPLLLVEV